MFRFLPYWQPTETIRAIIIIAENSSTGLGKQKNRSANGSRKHASYFHHLDRNWQSSISWPRSLLRSEQTAITFPTFNLPKDWLSIVKAASPAPRTGCAKA